MFCAVLTLYVFGVSVTYKSGQIGGVGLRCRLGGVEKFRLAGPEFRYYLGGVQRCHIS